MRYVKPFYREVNDDNERFGGILIPFIGGALIGGLFASNNRPNNQYVPYSNYNYYPPYYPMNNYNVPPYQEYITYNNYPTYYPYPNTYQ